jgi:hypothetical protein
LVLSRAMDMPQKTSKENPNLRIANRCGSVVLRRL